MKINITKRDILVFILGFMSLFVIEAAFDWDNNLKAFKEGLSGAAESPKTGNK